MITRREALAASSPYLWVLAGQLVTVVVVVAGWNLCAYRDALLDQAARLVQHRPIP